MAKYYITHSCGHEEEVELFGPGKERDRRIKQMESHECADCRAKHATERDISRGLSALKGSPKQVAWASDLRDDMFTRLGEIARQMVRRVAASEADPNCTADDVAAMVAEGDRNILAIYNGIARETSAKWIIETRPSIHDMMMRYL